MTVERLEDDKLQEFFDGELPEGEAEVIRREILDSETNRSRLAALEQLRDLLVLAADDVAAELSADDLYAKIRKGIDAERQGGEHRTLTAVEGGGARPVEGWKVWLPVAAGLAVAAAVLLFVLQPGEGVGPTEEQPELRVEADEPGMTVVEPPAGSEVEEVDFGANVGTVFEIEGEAGEPIAVVWINDEEPEQATQ